MRPPRFSCGQPRASPTAAASIAASARLSKSASSATGQTPMIPFGLHWTHAALQQPRQCIRGEELGADRVTKAIRWHFQLLKTDERPFGLRLVENDDLLDVFER